MSTPASRVEGPKTVSVRVTPGNPPKVSVDPVEISKSRGDQVQWDCPDCKSGFKVDFGDHSPFGDKSFEHRKEESAKSAKSVKSGPVGGNAEPGNYKYSLEVDGIPLDPGLKVTN